MLAPRTLIEATLPGMRERGWGRIVNTSSMGVREPIAGLALSNAHRKAAAGLFKSISHEVAGDGVTLNTIATGRIATDRIAELWGSIEKAEAGAKEQIPAGRLGDDRGVRRPGCLPVLGSRVISDWRDDSARRRAQPHALTKPAQRTRLAYSPPGRHPA